MKYFKLPESKKIHEVANENLVSLYVREGFIEVDKKGEPIEPETKENTEE